MSGGAAIAAVSAAIRNLLSESLASDPDLADTVFTLQAPDIARSSNITSNQLNLFLFRTAVNGAWSNQPLPDRTRTGENSPPPLALTLLYLLTVYGRDNDTQLPFSHLLLGRAMGVLHDNPILSPETLRASLPQAGFPRQIETVRLTLQPMSLDDLSKLWSGFQTQFRLSATYEASLVLIDSRRAVRAALPVLKRGSAGAGIALQPDTQSPMPVLSEVKPAAALIGDTVMLSGIHLAGEGLTIRLTREGRSWDLQPAKAGAEAGLRVVLPADQQLAAGVHAIAVLSAGGMVSSNALALAIMPRIVSKLPITVSLRKNVTSFALEIAPPVQPGQIASVLAGSRELAVLATDAAQARFTIPAAGLAAGSYVLRVRVDGVDSPVIVAASSAGQPEFDPLSRLTVTA